MLQLSEVVMKKKWKQKSMIWLILERGRVAGLAIFVFGLRNWLSNGRKSVHTKAQNGKSTPIQNKSHVQSKSSSSLWSFQKSDIMSLKVYTYWTITYPLEWMTRITVWLGCFQNKIELDPFLKWGWNYLRTPSEPFGCENKNNCYCIINWWDKGTKTARFCGQQASNRVVLQIEIEHE